MSMFSRRGFLLGSITGAASVGLPSALVKILPASAQDVEKFGDPAKRIDTNAVPIMGMVPGTIVCKGLTVDLPAMTDDNVTHARDSKITLQPDADGSIVITAQMRAFPTDEVELQTMLAMFEAYMAPPEQE